MRRATSSGGWIIAISRALDAAGCDSSELFTQAGLELAHATDSNSRFDTRKMARVWQLAVELTGDEALGLRVANYVKPTTFHALGYSIWASDSLKDALQRLGNYIRVVSNAGELRLEQDTDCYRLRFQVNQDEHGQPLVAHEALDGFIAALLTICRDLDQPDLCPSRILFDRPAPRDTTPWQQLFNCPMQFGAAQTMIEFGRDVLERPLPTANPELAVQSDQVVIDYLARLEWNDIVSQVRARVVEMLPAGEPGQENVAKALNLSLRNLQRKLHQADTTYTQVVEDVRHELARQYLEQSHLAINEICYMLGFASLSSFSRAFKRWTGKSPALYRSEKTAISE